MQITNGVGTQGVVDAVGYYKGFVMASCKKHKITKCIGDECPECLIKELRERIKYLEQVVIELTEQFIFGDDDGDTD